MKEAILFSKTIRKILSVFVTSPRERFYLRQLCLLTGTSPRPVQLALSKLQKAGILNFKKEANIKFYTLNKESPIYAEIRGIILKTEAIGGFLRKGLSDLKDIKCAFIYGSTAKDKERKGSDIDICIIGKVDFTRLSNITARLEERLKREVSTVTFTAEEFKKAIKEKKAFAVDILKNKKLILFGNLNKL